MKRILLTAFFASLVFSASASGNCGNDLNAQQSYDCIVAEASKYVDIEQAPSEGNSQKEWKFSAEQTYYMIISEASKYSDIEQAPTEGNSQMNWSSWKLKHLPNNI